MTGTGAAARNKRREQSCLTPFLALRQALGEALLELGSTRIEELIGTIGQSAPELAAVLGERVRVYDYETVMALLQAANRAAGEPAAAPTGTA